MRLKRLKKSSLIQHSAFDEKTQPRGCIKTGRIGHTDAIPISGGDFMEEQKCRHCGRRERMTDMLICSHCGTFFCADCANSVGNICPQCLGLLSRLN